MNRTPVLLSCIGFASLLLTNLAAADQPARDVTTTERPVSVMKAVGIRVSDLRTSADFYAQVLGVRTLQRLEFDQTIEWVLGNTGNTPSLVLIAARNAATSSAATTGTSGGTKLVFSVGDLAATMQTLRQLGSDIIREPTASETQSRRSPLVRASDMGLARDPDGNILELHQL